MLSSGLLQVDGLAGTDRVYEAIGHTPDDRMGIPSERSKRHRLLVDTTKSNHSLSNDALLR